MDTIIKPMIEKLTKHLNEAKKIYQALEVMKETTGVNFKLPDLSFFGDSTIASPSQTGINAISNIRPDQFFGKSNVVAAEEYLKMVGHAVSLDEIYDALIKGGITYSGDGKKTVYVSLTRSNKFIRVGKGTYGLKEFYPNIPKKRLEDLNGSNDKPNKEQAEDEEYETEDPNRS